MRKYTKFIVFFLLINIISNTAYASTLHTAFDDKTYKITISGNIEDYPDSRVMLQVLNPDVHQTDIADVTKDNFKELFSNVFEVQTDSKGCFEIPSYTPAKSGVHSIRLKYDNAAPMLYEDAFFYLSKDYVENEFLPALNSADDQAVQYIRDNAELAFGFDLNYKYLTDEYLQKAAEFAVAERNMNLSGKFDSRESFETVMKSSIMINLMENHKDRALEIFNYYSDDATLQTQCSPLLLCGDYVSSESVAKILSDTISENDYDSVGSFMKAIAERLILKAVSDVGVYMNVETILTQHEKFFGFELDDYKKIKDKSDVNEAISKSNPENIEELKSVIKTEVQRHLHDGEVSLGSGSGSSGRAPSSSGGGSVNVNITPPASSGNSAVEFAPTVASPFTDLDGVLWAKNAIDTLYDKGIINGTSSTEYSPHKNVTREEFIKLLTVAFVPQPTVGDIGFSDVKPDDWFYPYIADAYNRGLVKGITVSDFGTGLPITRQDMAVLAYRYALVFANSDAFVQSKSFSDSHNISDYAKEAAEKLAGASVISGMGNGSFEPLGYCNRAQAAVVIYNLIKAMEGK